MFCFAKLLKDLTPRAASLPALPNTLFALSRASSLDIRKIISLFEQAIIPPGVFQEYFIMT
jgi:hypothetical protein